MKEGSADRGARNYDDARTAFRKASQLWHDSCADWLLEMPIVQSKTGDFDHALKDCDKAMCAPTDSVRVVSHALKGNILQNGEPDPRRRRASEREYRAATALDANDAALDNTQRDPSTSLRTTALKIRSCLGGRRAGLRRWASRGRCRGPSPGRRSSRRWSRK
jgi:hypothetical protein